MTKTQKINSVWKSIISNSLRSSVTSLGLARFFSWIFLVLILVFSIFLSLFVGRTTQQSLISSQESYTLLLAENMNKQIFSRFTLPVAYASGRVALSDPDQYRLLDEVVDSLMYGLNIQNIRIFDKKETVAFSTSPEEVQSTNFMTEEIHAVFTDEKHRFHIISKIPFYKALFSPNLPDNTFIMRTSYPLTIDFELGPFKTQGEEDIPILGVMEILQDVTGVYRSAIRQQWTIFFGCMFSTLMLFIILQIVARTAERVISERIKQSKELEEELLQSEKLASMGRMVASIAHEVRNPLGIIKSSAEFLMNRKETDTTGKKLLGAIFDETSRLGVTVNDFLDYARPRAPSKQTIDIVVVINKVWTFLENSFEEKNITVDFHLPENLEIQGEEESLYRAIYNIFINAQDAMSKGSKKSGHFDIVGFKKRTGEIRIKFIDNGTGFNENAKKALDPFFTTKDTGTGLGLPIVQSIIHAHHGKIILENNDDGGATVELCFEKNIS